MTRNEELAQLFAGKPVGYTVRLRTVPKLSMERAERDMAETFRTGRAPAIFEYENITLTPELKVELGI